jgi:hypothetical protein
VQRILISFAKRLGLVGTDGVPTELYGKFRNANHSKGAMAQAIRTGFADLFSRNENAHTLDKKGLEGLVVQATGLDAGSTTLRSIVNSFENLKPLADFSAPPAQAAPPETDDEEEAVEEEAPDEKKTPTVRQADGLGMNLSYIINIVLPKTDDVAVFNAIFKSLRENLLRR